MLRRLCLSAIAIGLFLATQSDANAHGPGYRNYVARQAYYNGYRPGYYGGYGNGGFGNGGFGFSINTNGLGFGNRYGWGNNNYSTYGNDPYGYGYGSTSLFPANNGYTTYYNGYGTSYNPYGVGVYSSFNNGW